MSGLFHSTKRENTTDPQKNKSPFVSPRAKTVTDLKICCPTKVFYPCSFPTRTFMNFSAKPQRFHSKFWVNQGTFPSTIILSWAIIGMRSESELKLTWHYPQSMLALTQALYRLLLTKIGSEMLRLWQLVRYWTAMLHFWDMKLLRSLLLPLYI